LVRHGGVGVRGIFVSVADPAKVGRRREQGIIGPIKAETRSNLNENARFPNADLEESTHSQRGARCAIGR